jgi:protein ImuA
VPNASVMPDLDALRAEIARLQADTVSGGPARRDVGRDERRDERFCGVVPLGAPDLDATLGGGLKRGALHEVRSDDADGPLAFGFALALLARLSLNGTGHRPAPHEPANHKPALLITTFDGAGEWGRPYGPGLAGFGLDPACLLIVEARRPREALWAAEEGLASRALAAVVAEVRGDPAVVDLTATRRLALRAARGNTAALLVRPGTADGLTAARTRWRIGPFIPAPPGSELPGSEPAAAFTLPPPAWTVALDRNATRPGGHFDLVWNPHERTFAHAAAADAASGTPDIVGPALPRPAAATPAGGTARQDVAVLPFRRTG